MNSSDLRRANLFRAVILILVVAPLAALGVSRAAPRPVTNPHGKYKEDCALCHGAKGWKPVQISPKFDHAARSGFALDGAHAGADCRSCHVTLDFQQSATQCASCHEDVHRGEMGADCARCHTARSFVDRGAMTRQHQLTAFPLTGGHAGLDCETCHRSAAPGHLQFVGTRAECAGCHRADYDATTNPAHAASRFPLDCASCHVPTSWNRAKFDHALTRFPLTGAHRSAACAACHGDGVYRGKATDCVSCHQGDYDRTSDPPHAASSFPTACASCHSTTNWSGATFDHDRFFPIHSGAHQGRWSACSDCHTNNTNYAVFTCLSCHPHSNQNETDGHHQGRSGYRYESNACYSCHPRGRS